MRRLHVLDPCSNRTTAALAPLSEEDLLEVQGGWGKFVQSTAPTEDDSPPREPFYG